MSSLVNEYRAVVESSRDSNADDEHDPEGSTTAFERSQVGALSEQARRQITEIHAALARVDAWTYGRCIDCGETISADQLQARPAAERCIACAT